MEQNVPIREAKPEDAECVLALFERLYSETSLLLYEPGETTPEIGEYARRIAEATKSESGVMYIAEDLGEIVGVAFGNRGTARKTRHSLRVDGNYIDEWFMSKLISAQAPSGGTGERTGIPEGTRGN